MVWWLWVMVVGASALCATFIATGSFMFAGFMFMLAVWAITEIIWRMNKR